MPSDVEICLCRYCGGKAHKGLYCPALRSIEFYEITGNLKRVEFHEPPPECQHRNKVEMSTSGWERWRCKDCGFEFEKALI